MTEEMISTVAREAIGTDQVALRQRARRSRWRRRTAGLAARRGAKRRRRSEAGRDAVTDATARPGDRADLARGCGSSCKRRLGRGKIATEIFERLNEAELVQPTFVYDFPTEVSPLSKQKPDDPDTVERFELYIGGFEVANAFSELNDPAEQRRRFEAQIAGRAAGDLEAHAMDEDYIRALEYGLPPTGGEGVGHRSSRDAAHQQSVDPRRHPVPADAAREEGATRMNRLPFELFIAVRYLLAAAQAGVHLAHFADLR